METNFGGAVTVGRESSELLLVDLDLDSLRLAKRLDLIQRLGVPALPRQLPSSPSTQRGTHLVASKMSSNFFLSGVGSESGQLDSS